MKKFLIHVYISNQNGIIADFKINAINEDNAINQIYELFTHNEIDIISIDEIY